MNELARQALLQEGRPEEAITVNQRALIDKILARYSAEFTVFRELLQNADDAGATECELRFATQATVPHARLDGGARAPPSAVPNTKVPLTQWTFRNNGKPFSPADWNRLRRIAEGNPDPERIGAFGVGFYSLFSVCEEPIVASGDELMGFFWKGDALFTRRAPAPSAETSSTGAPWTTFLMSLREPVPFPESPLALSQFLATSLTFTAGVRRVALYLDDKLLCRLEKHVGPPQPITPSRHLNGYSPSKLLRTESLHATSLQVDVEVARLVLLEAAAAAEAERPSARSALASAFRAGAGLTSMLASAFGGARGASATPSVADASLYAPAQLLETVHSSLHLRVVTANVRVYSDAGFSREIERSTKKALPKTTPFHMVYMGKDDYDATVGDAAQDNADGATPTAVLDRHARRLFHGLMPRLDDQGRVFIGFRTHQTTSFSGHMAARFIPTVERESVDFIDRYCARWNLEMLAVGGYVARTVYEHELGQLGARWAQLDAADAAARDAGRQRLLDAALHAMRFFSFRTSSPSPRVSATLEERFFACCTRPCISLLSTQGLKPSDAVRFPSDMLAGFIKELAVLPPAHVEQAELFVEQLRARELVQEVTLDDVFGELGSRALSVDEMVACLGWWVLVARHPSYEPSLRARLVRNAVVAITAEDSARIAPQNAALPQETRYQPLSAVREVLNVQKVPAHVPLPPSCLVHEVSRQLSLRDLEEVFDWQELSVGAWLDYMVQLDRSPAIEVRQAHGLCQSAANAERVLGTLAWAWSNLPSAQRTHIAETLAPLPCIPTRMGMRRPGDAYFASVSLFGDLPVVALPTLQVKGNLEKLLAALHVRRHVEIQLIFDRLIAAGDWSHVDLVAYLTKHRDLLSRHEIERLTNTAIFPRADETPAPGKPPHRYKATQLYEPTEALRALQLPTLAWPGRPWRASSDEARFIFALGLRRHPPLPDLLALASAAQPDAALRERAFAYLLRHFQEVYAGEYTLKTAARYAFVPRRAADAGEPALLPPTDVFTDAGAAVMGWPVADLAAGEALKLQLRMHPTSAQLVERLLANPPRDVEAARRVFGFLATTREFTGAQYAQLGKERIVPVTGKEPGRMELAAPQECYFPPTNREGSAPFREIFHYVDYGVAANLFLRSCGVTDEPSVEEVTRKLVQDPARFYELCNSTETYLDVLRRIGMHLDELSRDTLYLVKRAPFLLGIRYQREDTGASEATSQAYALKRPAEVVIVDDANAHMLFAEHLYVAPHDDVLEEHLYEPLGAARLSTLVHEAFAVAGPSNPETPRARSVYATVLERTPLFLFEKRASASREVQHDFDWLQQALAVVEVGGGGLQLTRRLRYAGREWRDVQRCSAMATLKGGRLTLHVAADLEVDWFEVAQALSKHLLTRQRLPEVLLYMTVLSTPLRSLKRKGFNVDKILAQQRQASQEEERQRRELIEGERREAARRAAEAEQEAKAEAERRTQQAHLEKERQAAASAQLGTWRQQLQDMFPDADPAYLETLLASFQDHQLEHATESLVQGDYPRAGKGAGAADGAGAGALTGGAPMDTGLPPPEAFPGGLAPVDPMAARTNAPDMPGAPPPPVALRPGGGLLQQWKNRFSGGKLSSLASGSSSIKAGGKFGLGGQSGGAAGPPAAPVGGAPGGGAPGGGAPGGMASTEHIQAQVRQAINASRPDASSVIQSQAQPEEVREAASSYCDVSGVSADLRLAGEVAGMKVYVSAELDPAKTLAVNDAALRRLILHVYRPVGEIFGMHLQSLSVFCDTRGPSIAFNRGGSIFLNLRYYLAWHDADVCAGRLAAPLVSVYFSIAHEIAHNLVSAHNSEHEFYFSSIAEQYFLRLAQYISRTGAPQVEAP